MVVHLQLLSSAASSSTSPQTSSRSSIEENESFKVEGIQPDKFVQAAPLVIAAVCSDGVAVIAAHTLDENEPLLYFSSADQGSHPRSELSTPSTPLLDLPESFGGPFRIQTIDAYGTTLLATGWRADCDFLVEQAREMAAAEQLRHGTPSDSSSFYVSLLARELSLFMAQLAVSEGVRLYSLLNARLCLMRSVLMICVFFRLSDSVS